MKNLKKTFRYLVTGFCLILIFASFKLINANSEIPVQDSPVSSVLVDTDLYVMNSASGDVSVIDTTTNVVTGTISVGTNPRYGILVGTDLYVLNVTSDNISVIDTTSNTVTDTISIGFDAHNFILVGTDLYVSATEHVLVVDTGTNTVTDNIVMPTFDLRELTLVGTDLYISEVSFKSVVIVDTITNTYTGFADNSSPIARPGFSILVGTDLYVMNNNQVLLIFVDTLTPGDDPTINIGINSYYAVLVGTDLYILGTNSIKVFDTNTNTVTDTIAVSGISPFALLVGTDLYVPKSTSEVAVIDTNTNTITNTIDVGTGPNFLTLVGTDLYVTNGSSDDVTVINSLDNTVYDYGSPILSTAEIIGDTLTLTYDEDLDDASVPVVGDFVVNVNGDPVVIESVNVVGTTVILTLPDDVLNGDVVDISYVVPGSNMIQDLVGNDAIALTNEPVTNNTPNCWLITVGTNPFSSVLVGADLYVLNADNTVSVIDTDTSTVTDTIPVGSQPLFSTLVGTDLYVNNYGEDTISVINTNTNLVTDTITVGNNPYYSTLVGTDLYVTNSSDGTVSVINTNTNLVTGTINVGASPYFIVLSGTDLYVNNYSDGTVSVINTNTNLVTDTITVGNSPYSMTLSGTNLYVNNYDDGNISVININTNLVTSTIIVGANPYFSTLVGTDLYVSNSGDGTVSVINTNTNLVTDIITVGDVPILGVLSSTDLFIINYDDGTVSVINTNTNLVTDTISVDLNPQLATLVGFKLFVNNSGSNTVSVIDTVSETTYACGVSYNLLSYSAGANGSISGDTSQYVSDGGDGIAVTAFPDEGYDFTDWSDGSRDNPRTDTNVTGNISVTANFSLAHHTTTGSGSNPPPPPPPPPDDEVSNPPPPPPPDDEVLPPPPDDEILVTPDPVLPTEDNTPPDSKGSSDFESSNTYTPVTNVENIPFLDRISIFVKDPVGNVISRTLALGGLAFGIFATIFANIGSITDIGLNLIRLWSLFLYGVGLKKRNRPWGVVYDSVTKQPLDPVYVVLLDLKGQEIATSITDMDGRYGFLVEPGVYKIKVNKNNYNFPSEKLMGHTSDELYSDIYWGDYFEIKNPGEVIAKNIPMDPIGFNWNEFAKKEQSKMKYYHARDVIISRISDIFSVVGFLISFVILLVLPKPYNVIVFCLYIVLFVLRRTKLIRNKKGNVINDKTGIPLSYGILRVYSIATGVEVAHRVLDKKGNYYLLIGNGNYMVSLEKKNEDATYTKVATMGKIEIKHGILKKNFRI